MNHLDTGQRQPVSEDAWGLDAIVDLSTQLRALRTALEGHSRELEENLQELEVLTVLHRSGPPYRLHPGRLASDLGLTSGALTSRLDSLERGDLVRRVPDQRDRRHTLVLLSPSGLRRLADARSAFGAARSPRITSALGQVIRDSAH